MQSQQIITVMIGKTTYEKVCTCINGVITSLPQTYLKLKYKKIYFKKEEFTYTEEMQERAIKLQAAKKIKQQNKKIDHYRSLLANIITYNEYKPKYILGVKFVCDWLDNMDKQKIEVKQNKLKLEKI